MRRNLILFQNGFFKDIKKKTKKLFIVFSIIFLLIIILFITVFSIRELINSKIKSKLDSYHLTVKNINVDPFGKIILEDAEFLPPSKFTGGYIERAIVYFSPLNPKNISKLILINFFIPYRTDNSNDQSSSDGGNNIVLPEKIILENGSFAINGRVFNSLYGEVNHGGDEVILNFHFGNLICSLYVRKEINDYVFNLEVKGKYELGSMLKLEEIECTGRIRNKEVDGVFNTKITSSFFKDSIYNVKLFFKFAIDKENPSLYLEDYNIEIVYRSGNYHVYTDSFYIPLPENDMIDLIYYKISGNIDISNKEDTVFWLIENFIIDGLEVFSPYLIQDTVSFSPFYIKEGKGYLIPSEKYLNIDYIGFMPDYEENSANTIVISGDLRKDTIMELNLELTCHNLSIPFLIENIPKSLIPHISGIQGRGSIDMIFSLSYNSSKPDSTEFVMLGDFNGVQITSLGSSISLYELKNQFTTSIKIGNNKGERIIIGPDNPYYVPFYIIPKHVWGAVLTCEDGGFWNHHGFSIYHLRRALRENLSEGRYSSGGSTITMQLARNLYLSGDKTLSRKLEEAVITWQLEQHLTKERILEIYLNIIEFGPGIRGIGQASYEYFNLAVYDLNPLQAAYLASIIPNPNRYYRLHYQRNKVSEYWHSNLYKILKLEVRKEYIDSTDYEIFSQDSIVFYSKEFNEYLY